MKKIAGAIVLIVAAIAAYLFFAPNTAPEDAAQPVAPAYVAAEGKVETMPGYDINVGIGELNGRIDKILVKEGETVQAGQIVATLYNEDHKARVKTAERELAVAQSKLREIESGARREEILEAEAALEGAVAGRDEAQKQLERYRELRREGMIAQATLDERERAFKAAQARMKEAEQRLKLLVDGPKRETVALYRDEVQRARAALDYARALVERTIVRAPISGTVIQRYLDEGEGVTPEYPILAIADLDKVWVNAEVDETDVGRIAVGDPVEIRASAYPGRVFKGRIARISEYVGGRTISPSNPGVNLGLKVAQVKVELAEKTPLKLGLTVDVRILPGTK